MTVSWPLPRAVIDGDIDAHERDVERFLSGDLSPLVFKSRRVPRGIYEQRRDGFYMVRVRVPAGRMTWRQAVKIAELAGLHGSGKIHITDRQDVQIHDVAIGDTAAVMRGMAEVGLVAKGGGGNTVRNVTACPMAGLCVAELFDVAPYAEAVTGYLLLQAGSYNLPRKYKIAFSGCGADCALTMVADLGFVAKVRDGRPGFAVYAGGGLGSRSRVGDLVREWIDGGDVVRYAEAVRRVFDRHGDRQDRRKARLRHVFDRLGPVKCGELIDEAFTEVVRDGVPVCDVRVVPERSPVEGASSWEEFAKRSSDGLSILPEHDESLASVRLHVPMGFLSAADFRRIGELAGEFSSKRLLLATQGQTLVIPSVARERLKALGGRLSGLSFDAMNRAPLASFTVCAGADTCRLGLCHSRPAAEACAAAIRSARIPDRVMERVVIKMNGCPNACGQHPVGDIGLHGAAQRVQGRLAPFYVVSVGARRMEGRGRLGLAVGSVPARRLPALIVDILGVFARGSVDGESFADYVDRVGIGVPMELVARHGGADGAESDDLWVDWGQSGEFSLAGRGAGECGMGVFEVINHEIAAAKRALEKNGREGGRSGGSIRDALLATARSLLIVKGVDTPDEAAILREFGRHFIDTGLVDSRFSPLFSPGAADADGLAGSAGDVEHLLERVEYLFSTLDGALVFHVGQAEAGGAQAPVVACKQTAELDLKGVACPMNFVKAKLRLEAMAVGDELALILDDGEPAMNVPASFRNEGQEIADIGNLGDGHWRVVVRKTR